MVSIKALAYSGASLHIQATGAQKPHWTAVQSTALPPQVESPRPSTRRLKAEHRGTIAIIAAEPHRDTSPAALPSIFTLMEHRAGNSPHYRLKRLENLTLAEHPPLVVCVETPELHIRVLWGV